jgi:peroxiredoxin
MRIFQLFLIIIFIGKGSFALTTTIKGNAPSYSNGKVEVYTYSDYITLEKKVIAEILFSKNGDFETKLEIDNITLIYIDLFVFRGSMFLEPGKTYDISLPTKTLPITKELHNPFLQQNEIDIYINNSTSGDLNDIIGSFDLSLNRFILKHVGFAYGDFRPQADTAAYLLDSVFSYNNSEFFVTYKSNKLRQLKQMAYRLDYEAAIRVFFTYKSVSFQNPAYMELFNNVFQDFFIQYSKINAGKGIMEKLLSYKSYYLVKKHLMSDYFIFKTDSLADLAILKGINDAFTNFSLEVGKYENFIPRKQLFTLLDSIYYYCPIASFKTIAVNIKEKYSRLLPGTPAPKFNLKDAAGNLRTNEEFAGKYIYLNFTTTWNYENQKEFDLMEAATQKYKDSLVVVTIICDSDFEGMTDYIGKTKTNWPVLHFGNNKELLKNYDIQVFPTYYVIDKNGKIFLNPAKPPSEDFEKQFFFSFSNSGKTNIPWFDEVFEEKKE